MDFSARCAITPLQAVLSSERRPVEREDAAGEEQIFRGGGGGGKSDRRFFGRQRAWLSSPVHMGTPMVKLLQRAQNDSTHGPEA